MQTICLRARYYRTTAGRECTMTTGVGDEELKMFCSLGREVAMTIDTRKRGKNPLTNVTVRSNTHRTPSARVCRNVSSSYSASPGPADSGTIVPKDRERFGYTALSFFARRNHSNIRHVCFTGDQIERHATIIFPTNVCKFEFRSKPFKSSQRHFTTRLTILCSP